jgi:hypothetical protein
MMGRDYTPGLYTVTTWNRRAIRADRVVYRGEDGTEAARIFDGLARWKRRGLVQLTSPIGLVSTVCRTGDASKDWETRFGHPGAYVSPAERWAAS